MPTIKPTNCRYCKTPITGIEGLDAYQCFNPKCKGVCWMEADKILGIKRITGVSPWKLTEVGEAWMLKGFGAKQKSIMQESGH